MHLLLGTKIALAILASAFSSGQFAAGPIGKVVHRLTTEDEDMKVLALAIDLAFELARVAVVHATEISPSVEAFLVTGAWSVVAKPLHAVALKIAFLATARLEVSGSVATHAIIAVWAAFPPLVQLAFVTESTALRTIFALTFLILLQKIVPTTCKGRNAGAINANAVTGFLPIAWHLVPHVVGWLLVQKPSVHVGAGAVSIETHKLALVLWL